MTSTFLGNNPHEWIVDGVRSIISPGGHLDVAVSYVQVSGWNRLNRLMARADRGRVRLLLTDQFALTHPTALARAIRAGVQVRRYSGRRVYHPKVYLSRNGAGIAQAAVIGSANLSESGLKEGIEGAIVVADPATLQRVAAWFDGLWSDPAHASPVDQTFVNSYRKEWRTAAKGRVRLRRYRRKRLRRTRVTGVDLVEETDVVVDVCETIRTPIAVLSLDQAGNNIRNLHRLLTVVHAFPAISNKALSELRLLGLVNGRTLNQLGLRARRCRTIDSLARVWCSWVKSTPEAELRRINENVASFKLAARRFWTLREAVKAFFFENLEDRDERDVLMAIEILCSASGAVEEFALEDFSAVVPVLKRAKGLPGHLRTAITKYYRNKGQRTWGDDEREILLNAWRTAP